ncbi:hypothetical protein PM082_014685 [Marasmius tenuissimus]|nr:hypothetical protein PM082_014685 [Marasmius tenuissimus]
MSPLQPHLETLPLELLTRILESLPLDSRLALTSTSSSLRSSLAPLVFQALKITSNTQGGRVFEQLANNYGSVVTKLHFVASMPLGRPSDDLASTGNAAHEQGDLSSPENSAGAENATQNLMTTLARDALTGKSLPNLTTVHLSFDFDFDHDISNNGQWDGNIWDDPNSITDESNSIYVFTDPEAPNDVPIKEAKYPWRALMAQTWSALCQNKSITKLIVSDLIPRKTTAFDSDDWRDFLGRLETLELSMWGGENGAGWEVNTLEGYMAFEARLGEYFFQHLTRVHRLSFAAYSSCPFGATEEDHGDDTEHDVPFPLSKEDLPCLRSFELHNILISKKLAEFILSKSATLHKLRLHECHASSYDEERTTWAKFFTHFDRNKSQIQELHVTYEQGDPELLFDDEENKIKKENEEDKVFSYGTMDDKYGGFVPDDETIREKYEEKRDLDAYHRLADSVRQRREGDRSRDDP